MKKSIASIAIATILLPTLSGCVPEAASSTSEVVFVGVMGSSKVLDPAGTRSLDDAVVLQQIFPSLMNSDGGAGQIVPEIAVSAEYTGEFEYTVELKPNLTFSNGHELTASDVAHSIERIKTINDPNGPAVMLQTLGSVEAVGDTTVVFKPTRALDQALPALLAGLPGLVVDEEVFPADRLLSNGEVAGSNAFAGPYKIGGYSEGNAVRLNPNEVYAGAWGVPQNKGIELRFYSNADLLMFDSTEMVIDVAIVHRRSLVQAAAAATQAFAIDFVAAPNVEVGYFLINPEAENMSEVATRDVFGAVIDSRQLVGDVFGSLYEVGSSFVPKAMGGRGDPRSREPMEEAAAKNRLERAGVTTPVKVEVTFSSEMFGVATSSLMDGLKAQADDLGIFEVTLKQVTADEFAKLKAEKSYEVLFDYHYPAYADAEAFLFPAVNQLGLTDLADELEGSSGDSYSKHEDLIQSVDSGLTSSGYVKPLIWSGRHALVRDGISGAEEILGADGKLVLAKLYRILVK